jgi:hypothetical protein
MQMPRPVSVASVAQEHAIVGALGGIILIAVVAISCSEAGADSSEASSQSEGTLTEYLEGLPERPWAEVSGRVLTVEHGESEFTPIVFMGFFPDLSRMLWYQGQREGSCKVWWLMLDTLEVKPVELIPPQFAQRLRIDDAIVSPDSKTVWFRLGRSVGERHWAAKCFKYDIATDTLEYEVRELQTLIDDKMGDRQSEVIHPVWSVVGQRYYENQNAAEGVDATSFFWRQNDVLPVRVTARGADSMARQWHVAQVPGMGGPVFRVPGVYEGRLPLLAASPQDGVLILRNEAGAPVVYSVQEYGRWKSTLSGHSGRITVFSVSGVGVFVQSQDTENYYLDLLRSPVQ